MLALFRADDGLLYKAIGVLISDFPPIPTDPYNAAYLPVKALKLLGRCYDRHPSDAPLVKAVQSVVGTSNLAVDAEARYTLGIVHLYDAFRAPDRAGFLGALANARDMFATVIESSTTPFRSNENSKNHRPAKTRTANVNSEFKNQEIYK